jgi:hypothetical protein
VIPVNPAQTAHYLSELHNPLSFTANWDGPNYLRIAKFGYSSTGDTNFFPLYPLLIHIVNYIIGSPLISGLLISWASFIGAIYYYLKISKLLFDIKDNLESLRSAAFFMLFPSAVFMFVVYSEGLFAFLALGAIYHALKRKYLLSGLFLMFSTATHITGLFVMVLVAGILLEEKVELRRIVLNLIISSLGIVAYMFYLLEKFHQPIAFLTSQKSHGWLKSGPTNLITSAEFLNVVFVVLLLISAAYWYKRRVSFSIYSLLFILIPLIGRQYGGFNRYVLMAFPLPLMFYEFLRNKKSAYAYGLVLTTIIWTYFVLQYMGGYVGG